MNLGAMTANDFDFFDNQELVTIIARDTIGKILATYTGVQAFGRPERRELTALGDAQVMVIKRRWNIKAAGTNNPIAGVKLLQGFQIVTGSSSSVGANVVYVIQSTELQSWGTRWTCETERPIT